MIVGLAAPTWFTGTVMEGAGLVYIPPFGF